MQMPSRPSQIPRLVVVALGLGLLSPLLLLGQLVFEPELLPRAEVATDVGATVGAAEHIPVVSDRPPSSRLTQPAQAYDESVPGLAARPGQGAVTSPEVPPRAGVASTVPATAVPAPIMGSPPPKPVAGRASVTVTPRVRDGYRDGPVAPTILVVPDAEPRPLAARPQPAVAGSPAAQLTATPTTSPAEPPGVPQPEFLPLAGRTAPARRAAPVVIAAATPVPSAAPSRASGSIPLPPAGPVGGVPAGATQPPARPTLPGSVVARPAYVATTVGGTPSSFDVPAFLGANAWYNAGYTGTNARVANIEGGTPSNVHETMSWVPTANYFAGQGAISGTAAFQWHPTAVSHAMVGQGAGAIQRGVAYTVAPANFFPGNIATSFDSDGSFSISGDSLFTAYRDAMITGVNGNPNNIVNVINSSYGSRGGTTTGFEGGSQILDALIYNANTAAVGRNGVSVVFAAGNSGPGPNTVGAPSAAINVLTVASLGGIGGSLSGTPTYNSVSAFSSRSPSDFFIPNNANVTSPDPANGTVLTGVRARIDISAPGELMYLAASTTVANAYGKTQGTSFAAPTVAGGVALMSDYVRSSPGTFTTPDAVASALDGRVAKAALLNSADKTGGWSNNQAFTPNAGAGTWATTQALDFNTGAGRMNLDQLYRQYAQDSVTQLTSAGVTNTVNPTGWARGTVTRTAATAAASQDFILGTLAANSELNTTLSFYANRAIDLTTGGTTEVAFHNLALQVWRIDPNTNAFVERVGESNAPFIGTEHLSFLIPQAGRYAIRVTRPAGEAGTVWSFAGDDNRTAYGLAWLNRDSATFTSGENTASPTVDDVQPNLVIAPDPTQTAAVTYGTLGLTNFTNSAYIGGTDRGIGGTGTLTVSGGSINVSNRVTVFDGSKVNLTSGGTLTGGVLDVRAGGTVQSQTSGSSTLQFERIDLGGDLFAGAGSSLAVSPIFDTFTGGMLSRINMTDAGRVGGDGTLTINVPVAAPTTLTKVGTGLTTVTQSVSAPAVSVNGGTLRQGGDSLFTPGSTITVNSGATFDIAGRSNTPATELGQIRLNGGRFTATSGSGDYYVSSLNATGGTVDFTGTSNFWFHAGSGGITTNASSTPTVFTVNNAATRVQNDTSSPLPINVAQGSTPAGIDLDFGVTLSNGGTNPNFVKRGPGTMRLTANGFTSNTGNFIVEAGNLRVDSTNLAQLGTGALTLNGGALRYGNATADGMTTKAITIGAAGGGVSVPTAGVNLTLTGNLSFGGNLSKVGPGTLTLSGTSTSTAGAVTTTVSQGQLRLNSDGVVPAGSTVSINDNASVLLNNVSIPASVTVRPGGLLFGSGGLPANGGAATTLTVGGTLSPGATTGARAIIAPNAVAFNGFGRYTWDVAGVPEGGVPGTTFDFVNASGSLSGTANMLSRFTIDAVAASTVTGFDASQSYAWTIATFAGGTGLSSDAFTVNPVNWTGLNGGTFASLVDGTNLQVVFTPAPVPEPAALLGVAALGLAAGAWRKRGRRPA